MEIKIVPVITEESVVTKPIEIVTADSTIHNLEEIFANFLEMEVGDGAASADTIRSYLSQTKMYFEWCKDNFRTYAKEKFDYESRNELVSNSVVHYLFGYV